MKTVLPAFTEQMFSSIIWAMEDVDNEYLLSISDGMCLSTDLIPLDSEDTFIPIPPWSGGDGFRLMQLFASKCEDRQLGARLMDILDSRRRGIFRIFKQAVGNAGALNQWYDFHDSYMKTYIRTWYKSHASVIQSSMQSSEGLGSELLLEYDINLIDCFSEPLPFEGSRSFVSRFLSLFEKRCAFEAVRSTSDGPVRDALLVWAFDPQDSGRACVLHYYIDNEAKDSGLFTVLFDHFNHEMARRHVNEVSFLFSDGVPDLAGALLNDLGKKKEFSLITYVPQSWNSKNNDSEAGYVI